MERSGQAAGWAVIAADPDAQGVAYRRWMDPRERFHRMEQETLVLGSARGLERMHPAWRRRGAVLLSVAVGVVAGAGAVVSWNDHYDDRPSGTQPTASAEAHTPVRLVLAGSSSDAPRDRYLSIDAVLLHNGGPGTATVKRIHRPGTSLSIRVPDLPVT